MPAAVRKAMGEAAVRIGRACAYVGAGTVELICQDGEFYFLEMNTRLQVEHPVTEMVTGLDLVELQLIVASGEPLPFSQEDVEVRGHSIEARVNAEDPAGGKFVPTPGRITRIRTAGGPWVRTDAGYESGDTVGQHFDNLVAKVVAWGPTGSPPAGASYGHLVETLVEGVPTTVPVELAVLSHPDFISVRHATTWLEQRLDLSDIAAAAPPGPDEEASQRTDVDVRGRRPALPGRASGCRRAQPPRSGRSPGRPCPPLQARLQRGPPDTPARRGAKYPSPAAPPGGT